MWRFGKTKEALWSRVIVVIVVRVSGVGFLVESQAWSVEGISFLALGMCQGVGFEVGDGSQVYFSINVWSGEGSVSLFLVV